MSNTETKFDRAMRTAGEALDYLRQLPSKIDQLTDEELLQHAQATDELMNAAQRKLQELREAGQEETKRFTHNEPARERFGFVPGIGIVRVTGICNCGRPLQPYDFEATARDAMQAICSGCHTVVLSIEPSEEARAA